MIKISYKIVDDKIVNLHSTGHAGYAEHGEDIVCSAVSAVLIGGLTNLSSEKNFKILVKKGEVEITALNEVNEHDQIVLETMIVQLRKIEESYSKFMRITMIKEWKEKEKYDIKL